MTRQYLKIPSSILCMVLCSSSVEQKLWGSKGITFLSSFILSLGIIRKMGLWWRSALPAQRKAILQVTFCITIQRVSSCMEVLIWIIKKKQKSTLKKPGNFAWGILLTFSWKIILQVTDLKREQMDNS